MHEAIYRLLLSAFPASFRKTHGDEALQLFRDRLHDESGFLRRLRLWLDLLADFASIRIHGYQELPSSPQVVAKASPANGPSFMSVQEEHLKASTLIWASVLATIICAALLIGLEHSKGHLPTYRLALAEIPTVTKLRPHVRFTYKALNHSRTPSLQLQAIVVPPEGGPVPTGKVNFHYGWRTVASGTLVDGKLVVVTNLPDDKELVLDALYLGDSNYSIVNSMETDPTSRFER